MIHTDVTEKDESSSTDKKLLSDDKPPPREALVVDNKDSGQGAGSSNDAVAAEKSAKSPSADRDPVVSSGASTAKVLSKEGCEGDCRLPENGFSRRVDGRHKTEKPR